MLAVVCSAMVVRCVEQIVLVPARSAGPATDYARFNSKEVKHSPYRMVDEVVDALWLVIEGGHGRC